MRPSNYDRVPAVPVPGGGGGLALGWDAIARRIAGAVAARDARRTVVTVECYPGVDEGAVLGELDARLRPQLKLAAAGALRPPEEVAALVAPCLGGDDPVFGYLTTLELPAFFAAEKLEDVRRQLAAQVSGLILVVGCGARLIHPGDIFIYADLARWEAQLRFRRGTAANLGAGSQSDSAALRYKRAFFVDWRVADRWKKPLLSAGDFFLDTTRPDQPKLADGEGVRSGLRHALTRPFRVVPYFDPAPWGGQWLKEVCDLDRGAVNFGWGFDCVPEENSLLLDFGAGKLELPAQDLVLAHGPALLGDSVHRRFGDDFPIRFDLLDTLGGGNLSCQVHPTQEFIRQRFGMAYTQDESYYLLEAGPGAGVFLGLQEAADPRAMTVALQQAQGGGEAFPAERYLNRWPARQHDHFLIPAGTVHCSGAGGVVLEISATPYIFTFKMWDWGRLGLDGRPRPIHLDFALANIDWSRRTKWTKDHLINRVETLGHGPGWREERTGLDARSFIETRRHWFTGGVGHDTGGLQGSVNVLNLVAGEEAVVESPDGAFDPFTVHYAETFIVPAQVGRYSVRPITPSPLPESATIKAMVRKEPPGRGVPSN
jgi:hypothetical protein